MDPSPPRPPAGAERPAGVYGLALVILVLALAKPQTTVAVPIERASIMLTIDYSGSMQAVDVAPSRLEAGRAAAERFLDEVPESVRVGLVAFNHSARLVESPTTDRGVVLDAIHDVQPSGGTATGEALAVRSSRSPRETDDQSRRVPSAIVLLSTASRPGSQAAGARPALAGSEDPDLHRRARHARRTIQVTDSKELQTGPCRRPQRDARGRPALGGRAFTARTAEGLSSVYKELGSRIGHRNEQREVTAAFAGSALALLAAGALLSLYWFRRLV